MSNFPVKEETVEESTLEGILPMEEVERLRSLVKSTYIGREPLPGIDTDTWILRTFKSVEVDFVAEYEFDFYLPVHLKEFHRALKGITPKVEKEEVPYYTKEALHSYIGKVLSNKGFDTWTNLAMYSTELNFLCKTKGSVFQVSDIRDFYWAVVSPNSCHRFRMDKKVEALGIKKELIKKELDVLFENAIISISEEDFLEKQKDFKLSEDKSREFYKAFLEDNKKPL